MDAPYVLNFARLSMSVDKLLTDDKISRSNLTKGSYFGSALTSEVTSSRSPLNQKNLLVSEKSCS